jgi:hypothetical protein
MSNKSSNGSSTGMISADDLTEKDPKRYEGCVDAFVPRNLDRIQRLLSRIARQNVGKRQLTFLKKLTPEKLELTPKRTIARIPHPWASLPLMNL